MRGLLTCAVCLLASASGAATEDGDALSLLQMSSSKVSVRSDKECNVAKKAARDAQKNLKTAKADHKAAKEALATWKAAKLALKESKEADAAAQGHMASVCPAPEVDNSPDQGCSSTAVNSYVLGAGDSHGRELLRRPLPQGYYGLEKVVPGGGVPAGLGTEMGTKLGVGIMQPCSVAWTTGTVPFLNGAFNAGNGKYYVGGVHYQLKTKIGNVASPCECREKADSVMTWPEAAAVEFKGNKNGLPGECSVWSMTPLEWQKGGFWLATEVTNSAAGLTFTCYLGNPEEWKQRLAAERAIGATMDKCRNTALWSSGQLKNQADPTKYAGASIPMVRAGVLDHPNPLSGTEGGRKLCLKWVKQDVKCEGAIAIQLTYNGQCNCVFSSRSLEVFKVRQLPNPTTEESPRNGLSFETCML